MAVVVVVNPGGCHRPQLAALGIGPADPGRLGYVGERSVAVVAVERIAVDTDNVKIVETIVVVVADRHPHFVAVALHAGFYRDVGKGAVAVVAIEPVEEVADRTFAVTAAPRR